jgi:iron complex transport system substrate-binding protein
VADASRIVVAGGSLTEILYDLGEQDRIVGVDTTSNYPADAARFPSIGYVRALSAEGVLSLGPTLILGEDDTGPPNVVDQLESVGVSFVTVPEDHSPEGIVDKVRCVGTVIGAGATAEALIADRLAPAAERSRVRMQAEGPRPRGMVVLGIRDGSPLVAGTETSGDGLLRMAGGENVFGDVRGWKPISPEAMALAAPEFIVIPERGVEGAGGIDVLLAHPTLALTPAARERRVFTMDGMTMLGFGPRTLEAAERLADAIDG